MMYDLQWATQQRDTIYLALDGTLECEEFSAAEEKMQSMFSEVTHRVSIVMHITNMQPLSMSVLESLRDFLSMESPNRGNIIIVAPSNMLSGLKAVIERLFSGNLPSYVRFSDNIEAIG